MKTIPNFLSLGRIFCGPIIIFLLAQQEAWALWATLCVMIVSEISDLLDGFLARRLGATSNFGKIVDPLADSLYRAMVFLAFLDAGWMPLWMVAIIVSRDILVSYLRIFAQQHGITLAARQSGKIKAIVQGIAQIATVTLAAMTGFDLEPPASVIAYGLLFVATAVTAWSAIDYTLGFLRKVDITPDIRNS